MITYLSPPPSPTTATAGGTSTSKKPGGPRPWSAGAWGFLHRIGHRHRGCRDAFSPGIGRGLPRCHDEVREAQPIDPSERGVGACLRRRLPGGFKLVSSAGGGFLSFARVAISWVLPAFAVGKVLEVFVRIRATQGWLPAVLVSGHVVGWVMS